MRVTFGWSCSVGWMPLAYKDRLYGAELHHEGERARVWDEETRPRLNLTIGWGLACVLRHWPSLGHSTATQHADALRANHSISPKESKKS